MKGIRTALLFGALPVVAARQAQAQPTPRTDTATFAGGCFWCLVPPFDHLPGVQSVTAGYTGGHTLNPSFGAVASGATGHAEAVQIVFDPATITYARLLDIYWHNIDPLTPNAQFCEVGSAYRSAIFVYDETQREAAQASKAVLVASHQFADSIVTEIAPAAPFFPAEAYHQNYYRKNAAQYAEFRAKCGRDRGLHELWDAVPRPRPSSVVAVAFTKPGTDALRQRLSPIQYAVTQDGGTERAFHNAYWDNNRPGIYVDVVSGEPLFSSTDKFESGTGWPSFTKPLEPANIHTVVDHSLFLTRTEVRSVHADSHLGHVFDDGPLPTHLRYCMNSAALRFIPADSLELEGYGRYRPPFRIVTTTSAGKLQR